MLTSHICCRGAESVVQGVRTVVQSSSSISPGHQQHQSAVEAALVRSREPSVSRAQVVLGRAPSPSRSLRIVTRSQSRERRPNSVSRQDGLLTVHTPPANR